MLVIVKYILNLTKPATEQEFTSLQNVLKYMKTNIESHHHKLFEEAVQLS